LDFTVSITDAKHLTAIERALVATNEGRESPLTLAGLVDAMVIGQCEAFGRLYLVPVISHVAFLKRFTAEERVAIRTAAAQSPAIDDYLEMLKAAGTDVDLTDPITAQGLQALEAASLLAVGRAAEILAL